jgi:hypothetical protein
MAGKTKITSFSATPEELEVLDALAKELGTSRSTVMIMGCYFLESMLFQIKQQGDSKVIEFKDILASRKTRTREKKRRTL